MSDIIIQDLLNAAIAAKFTTLETEIANLEENLLNKDVQIDQLNDEVAALEGDIDVLEARIIELESGEDDNTEELIAEIAALEVTLEEKLAQIATLTNDKVALQATIDEQNSQYAVNLAAKDIEIAALNATITDLETVLDTTNEIVASKTAEIVTLKARILELEANGAELPFISSISDASVGETAGAAIFTITLSAPSTRPVTVNYTTVNGTATAGQDYTATSGTLTFAPGVTSAQVSVPIINDTAVEAVEAFTLVLSNAGQSLAITDTTGTATITSDDVTAPPAPSGSVPLTFNDARFANNTTSNPVTLNGGTFVNRKITQTGGIASILVNLPAVIQNVNIDSRECIRVTAGADIRGCYLRANGTGDDHADVIQAYSPGQTGGLIKVTDTMIEMGTTAVNAGFFVADTWGGTVELQNVVFKGGLYGCRIHADTGKTVNVSLKDVFFVKPFTYGALLIAAAGGTLNITKWENVRYATIVNGVLVPGDLIARP